MMKRTYSLLPLLLLALSIGGCQHTREAYKAASGNPEAYAYVIAEHYSALVKEAADRKESGVLTGEALAKVQAADRKTKPFIIGDPDAIPPKAGLEQLAKAYTTTQSPEDELALQAALNSAVLALNDFINALKGK